MARERDERLEALIAVLREVRTLYNRYRVAAEQLHGQGEMSAGRRNVLDELSRIGPQTVPQLARARPVSRQVMQTLVDPLIAEGLVARSENPAHRRSVLLEITPRGLDVVAVMRERESRAFRAVARELEGVDFQAAAEALRALNRFLVGAGWRALAEHRTPTRRGRSAPRRRG